MRKASVPSAVWSYQTAPTVPKSAFSASAVPVKRVAVRVRPSPRANALPWRIVTGPAAVVRVWLAVSPVQASAALAGLRPSMVRNGRSASISIETSPAPAKGVPPNCTRAGAPGVT